VGGSALIEVLCAVTQKGRRSWQARAQYLRACCEHGEGLSGYYPPCGADAACGVRQSVTLSPRNSEGVGLCKGV
jgi:hypothetical protein